MLPEMQPLRHNFAAMRTCIEDIRLISIRSRTNRFGSCYVIGKPFSVTHGFEACTPTFPGITICPARAIVDADYALLFMVATTRNPTE